MRTMSELLDWQWKYAADDTDVYVLNEPWQALRKKTHVRARNSDVASIVLYKCNGGRMSENQLVGVHCVLMCCCEAKIY